MFNSDSERVKQAVRISDLISQYLPLKTASKDAMKGLCPFHREKTPSFFVYLDKGIFKCYGCQESGDVIAFFQKIEGIDFSEAIKRLKHDYNLEDAYMSKEQRRLYEVERQRAMQKRKAFTAWKNQLKDDLILYTNAQWCIYRVAKRQSLKALTEELQSQLETAYTEAVRRERALDELESMSDSDLMEWYTSKCSWYGIKNPAWVLTGWRKDLIEKRKM